MAIQMSFGLNVLDKLKKCSSLIQNMPIPAKLPEPVRASEAVAKKSQTKARWVMHNIFYELSYF